MSFEETFLLPKSKMWAVHRSKKIGKYYYYNLVTGKSFWKRPDGIEDDDIYFPEGFKHPKKELSSSEAEPQTASGSDSGRGDSIASTKNKRQKNCVEKKEKVLKLSKKSLKPEKRKRTKKRKNEVLKEDSSELPSYSDSGDDEPTVSKRQETNVKRIDIKSKLKTTDVRKIPKMIKKKHAKEGANIREILEAPSDEKRIEKVAQDIDDEYEEMDWMSSGDTIEAPSISDIIEAEFDCARFEWSNVQEEVTPMEIVNSEDTCLVIDTNILIHCLPLVERLANNEFSFNGSKILVIIPWQVLKELDHLKTRSTFKEFQCRSAIRFLHSCFSGKSKSGNVIAQKANLAEMSKDLIEIQVPDDHIIACCLQMMSLDKITVLLTNDINLCNKANGHNIDAFTKDELTRNLTPISLPLDKAHNSHIANPFQSIEVEAQKSTVPPLSYSVLKNMLPRRSSKVVQKQQTEACKEPVNSSLAQDQKPPPPPHPSDFLNNLLPRKSSRVMQKMKTKAVTSSRVSKRNLPNKVSSDVKHHSNSKSTLKCKPCNTDMKKSLPESSIIQAMEDQLLFYEYVQLSPSNCTESSSNAFKIFKIAAADFMFSVLKEGMSRTFKGDWTKRVMTRPPWSLDQLICCLQKHWMSLTDHFLPKDIDERLTFLRKFFNDSGSDLLTPQDLKEAINACFFLVDSLKNLYPNLVEKFEARLNSLSSGSAMINVGVDGSQDTMDEIPTSSMESILSRTTEQSDNNRCLDLLDRISSETSLFLQCLHQNMASCMTNGKVDFDSPRLGTLNNMKCALPKKISLTTNVLCCLQGIIGEGSHISEAAIDKLALSLTEGTDYPDPFFSKNDVSRFVRDPTNRHLVSKYLIDYEELRRNLLTASKELVDFRV